MWNPCLKVTISVVHVSFSIFLAVWYSEYIKCDSGNMMMTFQETSIHDSILQHPIFPVRVSSGEESYTYNRELYPVFDRKNVEENCGKEFTEVGSADFCAFRGIVPSVDVEYSRTDLSIASGYNMVFLMLLFEWITASFAVEYVGDSLNENHKISINVVTIVWNMTLFIYTCCYTHELPSSNVFLALCYLSILMIRTTLRIIFPDIISVFYIADGKTSDAISTRYFEYALTAPVLLLGVQGITTFARGWTFIVAFSFMAITNLLGIPLHKLTLALVAMKDDEYRADFQLLMMLTLFASWVSFLISWVVYFTEVGTFFLDMPDAIKGVVILLPIFFASFGVVGSVFYTHVFYTSVSRKSSDTSAELITDTRKQCDLMAWRYDILSLTIKLVVVLCVWFSDTNKPNSC
jgi:hypothetical protein